MSALRLNRSLIRVSGPDAQSFLQGLLTQDFERNPAPPVSYAALLSPQGKIVVDMFVWTSVATDRAITLDVDPSRGAELLRRLGMFKLRAKVELEDISEATAVIVSEAPLSTGAVDPRLLDGSLGYRAIVPRTDAPTADGASALRLQMLTAGIPDLAVDAASEEVFALEGLLEELNGVDFQKGCFVGQENVSRMKRRATTRRKFCPVTFDDDPPAFGTPILAGEAEIGSIRSGKAGRAMALVRLDRALEAQAKGVPLTAAGRLIRVDPPDWLILPVSPAETPP